MIDNPGYLENIYEFRIQNQKYRFAVRIPENKTDRPVLLIAIATDWKTVFTNPVYNAIPNIFLSAGYNVASFDLPNHGELVDEYGEGIQGWANAISSGIDIFEKIRNVGSKIIDIALKENLAWKETVVMTGVSRGGFAAMHIMAYDRRVYAAAVFAPVTDLCALKEFRNHEKNEIVLLANAENLVSKLADRFLFISIGEKDPRIDERKCFEFYAKLFAASKLIKPELFVLQGQTHGESASTHAGYIACAGFLFNKISFRINEKIRPG
ncbi:MAG: prolyl oligopeptidase family serine peptidase [Candidatus Omnitrophica bacterium]|nr:prolyl oligopeptidase family serine peptidase [Candidatus Omnitrophota bacterium]